MKNRNKTTKFPVVRFPVVLIDPVCLTERLLDFLFTYEGAYQENHAEG
jgi:hypothetical protein